MKVTRENSMREYHRLIENPPPGPGVPFTPFREELYAVKGKSAVAIVRSDDRRQGIREALRLIGGVERLCDGVKGEMVIKPNCNTDDPFPRNSHPETVRVIAEGLMEAVDHVLDHYDFVDPKRLGVAGGSQGGFLTNWIVTHTDRFKAAVTQRSVCNWHSFFGTSDIGWTFGRYDMEGVPWDDEEKYLSMSPIRYVANAKTPTLIIHADEDYRCTIDQAWQWFTALKVTGVPTELVIFPGEHHGLSRGGKPKHREQRLNHIIRWFKKYLK